MNESTMIELSCKAAETFVKSIFYEIFDSKRAEIHRVYREQSIVCWNGRPLGGLSTIVNFFQSLPTTQHVIESFDCQLMPIPGQDALNSIMIEVVGKVSYAKGKPQSFSQTFILTRDPIANIDGGRQYFVASDIFRFISA
jgi:NTF2-related export protein 1/2